MIYVFKQSGRFKRGCANLNCEQLCSRTRAVLNKAVESKPPKDGKMYIGKEHLEPLNLTMESPLLQHLQPKQTSLAEPVGGWPWPKVTLPTCKATEEERHSLQRSTAVTREPV